MVGYYLSANHTVGAGISESVLQYFAADGNATTTYGSSLFTFSTTSGGTITNTSGRSLNVTAYQNITWDTTININQKLSGLVLDNTLLYAYGIAGNAILSSYGSNSFVFPAGSVLKCWARNETAFPLDIVAAFAPIGAYTLLSRVQLVVQN